MKLWILVNIGCIECGVSTNIVGVFDDKEKALEIANGLGKTHGWREGGQNWFEVFVMPETNKIKQEYLSDKVAT